jgi:hypothetical protein
MEAASCDLTRRLDAWWDGRIQRIQRHEEEHDDSLAPQQQQLLTPGPEPAAAGEEGEPEGEPEGDRAGKYWSPLRFICNLEC